MNNCYIQKIPFLYLLLPYVHLSLIVDYYLDSLTGIIVSVMITAFLGFYSIKTRQLPALVISNLLNFVISFVLTRVKGLFQTPHTLHSPYLTITLLLFLFLLAQGIGIFWGSFFFKK
ncbi:hypothetical protein JZO67_002976 [Enterococcus sp. 665A]|uniref:Uncharacterized protein n=1 Tax=Candidatus Enterococcus ferrettii TaxID=2815324 RepID=A0ABV0ETT6_9ENTE